MRLALPCRFKTLHHPGHEHATGLGWEHDKDRIEAADLAVLIGRCGKDFATRLTAGDKWTVAKNLLKAGGCDVSYYSTGSSWINETTWYSLLGIERVGHLGITDPLTRELDIALTPPPFESIPAADDVIKKMDYLLEINSRTSSIRWLPLEKEFIPQLGVALSAIAEAGVFITEPWELKEMEAKLLEVSRRLSPIVVSGLNVSVRTMEVLKLVPGETFRDIHLSGDVALEFCRQGSLNDDDSRSYVQKVLESDIHFSTRQRIAAEWQKNQGEALFAPPSFGLWYSRSFADTPILKARSHFYFQLLKKCTLASGVPNLDSLVNTLEGHQVTANRCPPPSTELVDTFLLPLPNSSALAADLFGYLIAQFADEVAKKSAKVVYLYQQGDRLAASVVMLHHDHAIMKNWVPPGSTDPQRAAGEARVRRVLPMEWNKMGVSLSKQGRDEVVGLFPMMAPFLRDGPTS